MYVDFYYMRPRYFESEDPEEYNHMLFVKIYFLRPYHPQTWPPEPLKSENSLVLRNPESGNAEDKI